MIATSDGADTTWSDLGEADQIAILNRVADGESVDRVATEYRIKSSSLSRKMRGMRSVPKETTSGRNVMALDAYAEKSVFVYSDTHFPVADPRALACAKKIKDMFDPDVIINLGDTLDMYHFSRFSKENGRYNTLQTEIDSWLKWARWFYHGFTGESIMLAGNHDKRLGKMAASVPGLSGVHAMSLEGILSSAEFGCQKIVDLVVVNQRGDDVYPDGDMYFYHGSSARRGSGASARAFSDKLSGSSVMVGHSHRTAVVASRSMRGPIKSYEVGCLSSLDVDWDLYPDWSQSVMIGVVSPDFCDFAPVVIDRGKFMYNGVIYECEPWSIDE